MSPSETGAAAPVDIDYNPTVSPHREDPFPFYRWSRHEKPVTFIPAIGAWMITRYEDIVAVASDPRTFSSSVAAPPLDQFNPPEVLEILARAGAPGRHVVQADPPLHEVMRTIGQQIFHGRRINSARPRMCQIADELIDGFAPDGQVELVSQFARPFVHRVLSTLAGVPVEDMDRVAAWNDSFLMLMTPVATLEQKLTASRLYVEYEDYLLSLIKARRARPRNDMLSDLVTLTGLPGTPVSTPDVKMFIRGLYAGGIHTTQDAICSAVFTMLSDQDHWRSAVADPARTAALFEETLRRDAPHRGLTRLVTRDVEIGGTSLPAGSLVLLLYGSANRDEKVFPDPDEFHPDRDNIREHLAFGHGIHTCLGAHLARTEGRIALEVLTRRLPDARIADGFEPVYNPAFYFRGLERLDLRW